MTNKALILPAFEKGHFTYYIMPAIPASNGEIRFTLHEIRSTKHYVRKNKLFLQNEPKFRKSQMNLSYYITMKYDQMDTWSNRKNEPKTNPILANKSPERTQFKPKQTQFQNQNNAALGLLELYAKGFRTDIIMVLRSLSGKTLFKGYT